MDKKLTIRKKIILSFISILLLALSISGGFFSLSYYQIRYEDKYTELDRTLTNIAHSLSSNFSSVNNLASNFISTPYIRSWMNDQLTFSTATPSGYDTITTMKKELMYELIFDDAWLKKYIDSFYLFADDQCIPLVSRVAIQPAIEASHYRAIYRTTKPYEIGTYLLPPMRQDGSCYYVKKIGNTSFTKNLTLIININEDYIAESLHQLPEDYIAYVYDTDANIFFSKNQNSVPATSDIVDDHKAYLNIRRPIEATDLSISFSVPKSSITNELFASLGDYIVIMIIFIIIFIILALVVVGNYTRIIEDILIHINAIRQKNYATRMPPYKDEALNTISTTFNTMAEEFQTLIDQIYKSELLVKEADIKLLQSQMNPHFLLNTLTTISTKALLCGEEEIYEMVSALSGLLNASLYAKQESFCKIADELEYIKMYLYIQHIRFEDKLQYTITVEDDSLLESTIPRLSIEPIVENAVIHGLEDNLYHGIINICIGRDTHHNILITVSDNGKGFDVHEMLNSTNKPNKQGHHIGIFNTDKRLKLIYGSDYGITFKSAINKGTTALIKVPITNQLELLGED